MKSEGVAERIVEACRHHADPDGSILIDSDADWLASKNAEMAYARAVVATPPALLERDFIVRAPNPEIDPGMTVFPDFDQSR